MVQGRSARSGNMPVMEFRISEHQRSKTVKRELSEHVTTGRGGVGESVSLYVDVFFKYFILGHMMSTCMLDGFHS